MPGQARSERKPWHHQFDHVVPKRFDFMKPLRREMQITTDWIRNRLGFVVIKHAGQIAPARISTQFDQPGANHDPKSEPAEKPQDQQWRPAFWEWSPVQ